MEPRGKIPVVSVGAMAAKLIVTVAHGGGLDPQLTSLALLSAKPTPLWFALSTWPAEQDALIFRWQRHTTSS